jgi:peptidoglycan DL-endopeptidase CwlO
VIVMSRAGWRSEGTRQSAPRPRHRIRHIALTVATSLSIVVASGPAAGPASANPIDDKRKQAERIAARRAELIAEAERLNEQAKAAEDELVQVTAELDKIRARLTGQEQVTTALRRQAVDLAINTYMRGDMTNGLGSLVSDSGAVDLQLRRGYAPLVVGGQADVLDQARAAAEDTAVLASQLDAKKSQQERLRTTVTQRRAGVDRTQQELAATAKQVDRDLQQLIAAEEARKAAEAEAAALARQRAEAERIQREAEQRQRAEADKARVAAERAAAERAAAEQARQVTQPAAAAATAATSGPTRAGSAAPKPGASAAPATAAATSGGNTGPTRPRPAATAPQPAADPTPAPAPVYVAPAASPAAAIAVAEALRQLGKPYVFGAAGPDTFDCSGLMQWAWAKAGVSMPHYTVSQFHAFPRVSVNDLQPGDLIFFSLSLGHVGMYIGNGSYVQAPRTGDVVKISSLSGRPLVGAVRPG